MHFWPCKHQRLPVSINPRCSSWCAAPTRRSHNAHLLPNTIMGPRREGDEKRFSLSCAPSIRRMQKLSPPRLSWSTACRKPITGSRKPPTCCTRLWRPRTSPPTRRTHDAKLPGRCSTASCRNSISRLRPPCMASPACVLRKRRCHRPVPERELHLSHFSEALRREEAV